MEGMANLSNDDRRHMAVLVVKEKFEGCCGEKRSFLESERMIDDR
jgi:hypothetical protein